MSTSALTPITPTDRQPTAVALSSPVALFVENNTGYRLGLLTSANTRDTVEPYGKVLYTGLNNAPGLSWLLLSPKRLLSTYPGQSDGTLQITTYSSTSDALPAAGSYRPGNLYMADVKYTDFTDVERGLRTFNAKEFGAVGDGTTDDRPAIQAALDVCRVLGGGSVYLPAGTYLLASSVTHPNSNVPAALIVGAKTTVYGDGFATVVKLGANATDLVRVFTNYKPLTTVGVPNIAGTGSATPGSVSPTYPSTSGYDTGIAIRDLFVDGNNANQGSATANYGIDLQCVVGVRIAGVTVKNVLGTASMSQLPSNAPSDASYWAGHGIGISTYACKNVFVDRCVVYRDAGHSSCGFRDASSTSIRYLACVAYGLDKSSGFHMCASAACQFDACHAYSLSATPNADDAGTAFYLDSCRTVTCNGCHAGGLTSYVGSFPDAASTSLGCTGDGFDAAGGTVQIVQCFARNCLNGVGAWGGADVQLVGGVYQGNTTAAVNQSGATARIVMTQEPMIVANGHEVGSINISGTYSNATGPLTAPGVPATGSNQANIFPFPVLVRITDSGVTWAPNGGATSPWLTSASIQIQGFQGASTGRGTAQAVYSGTTAAGPFQVVLQPNDKLRLDYSAGTPAWTWQSLL